MSHRITDADRRRLRRRANFARFLLGRPPLPPPITDPGERVARSIIRDLRRGEPLAFGDSTPTVSVLGPWGDPCGVIELGIEHDPSLDARNEVRVFAETRIPLAADAAAASDALGEALRSAVQDAAAAHGLTVTELPQPGEPTVDLLARAEWAGDPPGTAIGRAMKAAGPAPRGSGYSSGRDMSRPDDHGLIGRPCL